MVRQLFLGPLIQTNDKEELIIKENVAVLVDNGKVFNDLILHTHLYICIAYLK